MPSDTISWRLPLEVCENVIDYVSFDSWTTVEFSQSYPTTSQSLHACTLVCRDWLPRARINLYRYIHLDSKHKTAQFVWTLSTRPPLGEYVDHLCIDCFTDHAGPNGWIYYDLRTLLPNIRKLEYRSLPTLHSIFAITISQFSTVRSLYLRDLVYQSFRETVHVVNALRHLEELTIASCRWKTPGRFFSGKRHAFIALNITGLEPSATIDTFCWAVASHSTTFLTKVQLDVHDYTPEFDLLLASCLLTLKALFLNFHDYVPFKSGCQ